MRFHAKAHAMLPVAVVAASVLCGACSKPPPTTTKDVLDYVRNVEAGAAVRRLDNEAQAYIEAVMAAYGAYQAACEPVADLAGRAALWSLPDAMWRDTEEVTKLRDELKKWQADEVDPADASGKTRAQLRSELSAAITGIPSLPDGNSTTNSRMITEIRSLLDTDSEEARNAEIARAYLELLTAAIDQAGDFDPDATGLAFKTDALTTRVTSSWQKLHDMVEEPLEEELATMTDRIASDQKLRKEALEEKQSIRGQITSDVEKLRRYRELELLVEYYDARIRTAERRIKELEKEASDDAAFPATTGTAHP